MIRAGAGWQLLLADLAMILFVVALASISTPGGSGSEGSERENTEIAAAQALFREMPGGPSLARWLAERPADPRATLTIFAHHRGTDEAQIWEQARALASAAARQGYETRILISRGGKSDVYASLAYDAPASRR